MTFLVDGERSAQKRFGLRKPPGSLEQLRKVEVVLRTKDQIERSRAIAPTLLIESDMEANRVFRYLGQATAGFVRNFKELKATLASDAKAAAEAVANHPGTTREPGQGAQEPGIPSEPARGSSEPAEVSSGTIGSVNSEERGFPRSGT